VTTAVAVALGAAVGAPLRYLVDRAASSRWGTGFPWGTMAVNLVGSFMLGVLTGLSVSQGWSALLGTGFCGALTTYSTFSYQTLLLVEAGSGRAATLNVVVSVSAGTAAAAAGVWVAVW
jgi:CrcB protein